MKAAYKNGGRPKAGDVVRYQGQIGFVGSAHGNGTVCVCTALETIIVMAADCERGKVTFPAKKQKRPAYIATTVLPGGKVW